MSILKTAQLAAAVLVLGLSCTGGALAQTKVLRYSSFNPLQAPVNTDGVLPWAEEVAKVTEGRVRIDPLPKMVGSANSQYDVVSDGLADISFIVPGYTPARFDALALAELPFITDDPEVGAVATYRWYDKHVKALDLFKEVHVLSIFTTSAGTVLAKTPIKSIEDFKGRKVRSPLPITLPMLQAVGAVPVLKPGSEAFEMLSTGALDASLSGAEQAITFHLGEVTKQMLIVPGGIYNSVCMIGINKKVWNSLSEADRAAIERISGEALARRMGASFLKPIADAKAYMTSKGNAVETASPEMVAQLKTAWKDIEASVLERAKKNGVQRPEEALADLRTMVGEVQKSIR
jgi:TRAP-type C4-dicarboxylate transport system substrate-binding protein